MRFAVLRVEFKGADGFARRRIENLDLTRQVHEPGPLGIRRLERDRLGVEFLLPDVLAVRDVVEAQHLFLAGAFVEEHVAAEHLERLGGGEHGGRILRPFHGQTVHGPHQPRGLPRRPGRSAGRCEAMTCHWASVRSLG